MIEEILSICGLERDVDYSEDTIDSIYEMIAYSEIDVVDFIKNLKIFTLKELLEFNPRLTQKAREEYHKYLEEGDIYREEIVADLVLEHLRHTSNNIYYYNDDFHEMYYVYMKNYGK